MQYDGGLIFNMIFAVEFDMNYIIVYLCVFLAVSLAFSIASQIKLSRLRKEHSHLVSGYIERGTKLNMANERHGIEFDKLLKENDKLSKRSQSEEMLDFVNDLRSGGALISISVVNQDDIYFHNSRKK